MTFEGQAKAEFIMYATGWGGGGGEEDFFFSGSFFYIPPPPPQTPKGPYKFS